VINVTYERVKARKNFFRNLYRKELVILIISLITQIILIGMIMLVLAHRVVPTFYASSSDGILTLLKSMPSPNQSDKPLME